MSGERGRKAEAGGGGVEGRFAGERGRDDAGAFPVRTEDKTLESITNDKTMNSNDNFDLSFLQLDATTLDTRTLAEVGELIDRTPGDLVVLPEMFATGFRTDAAAVAQPVDGEIVTALRAWARESGKAVVGSVAVADGPTFRNRLFFARPTGELEWYDKRHLFRPGGETDTFTPGDRRTVVEYRGIRFLLLVCYDLRFPVWSRCRRDYDVILCSAAWPSSRRDVWRTLLCARALENQAWIVGANFCGEDPTGRYAGASAIVDCYGRFRAEAPESASVCRTVHFSLEEQNRFRERFPTWREADDFTLGQ